MVEQTSQTEKTELPASKEKGLLDRTKRLLSPFKSDRWLSVAIFAVIAASAPAVWNWVELQRNPTEGAKRKFDASLDIVKTVATVAGGAVLYLNFKVASQNAEIAQKKLEQDRDKAERDERLAQSRLKMERFNKAVEMLGKNDSIHLRLGGIYALESIAADSNKDAPDENYRQVLEVLTAFVRENAPYPLKAQAEQAETQAMLTEQSPAEQSTEAGENPKEELPPLPTDIQAVLTVLNRRKHKDTDWEQYPLDLKKTDLRKADLKGVNLQQADLEGVNLQQASLRGANLQEANLVKANLQKANLLAANLQAARFERGDLHQADLRDANLHQADLRDTNLHQADLRDANLQKANFLRANLQKARLLGANFQQAFLEGANLQEVYLGSVNFQQADLAGANFQQAVLAGADLRGASFWIPWLTDAELAAAKENAKANLQSATGWEAAKYDSEIREWLGLPPEKVAAE